MGLLASIVAYLSVVAVIVGGFVISADVLLNHSRHQTAASPEITRAVQAGSLGAKATAKPSRNSAEFAIPKRSTAAEYRRKTELSSTRGRDERKHPTREAHKQYGPHEREHAAAPRVFGYAQEPRFGGDPWR
jgi:hypothetical protein